MTLLFSSLHPDDDDDEDDGSYLPLAMLGTLCQSVHLPPNNSTMKYHKSEYYPCFTNENT